MTLIICLLYCPRLFSIVTVVRKRNIYRFLSYTPTGSGLLTWFVNENLATLSHQLVLSPPLLTELVCLYFQICKDKVEAEVWIAGLKALIAGQCGRSKIDGWSDGGLSITVSYKADCFSVVLMLQMWFFSSLFLFSSSSFSRTART